MQAFFILIKCEIGHVYKVAETIADAEVASEIFSIAGDYDLIVKCYIEAGQDIGRYIADHIHSVPGIASTNTVVTYKAF